MFKRNETTIAILRTKNKIKLKLQLEKTLVGETSSKHINPKELWRVAHDFPQAR